MPSKSIRFFSDGVKYSLRHQSKISRYLQLVASKHSRTIDSLYCIFVPDKRHHEINVQFLNHDTLTDIITFPMESARGTVSGEIYISIDRVKDNARQFDQSIKAELSRVMAHGLLHLCGFEDKSKKDQLAMRTQEE